MEPNHEKLSEDEKIEIKGLFEKLCLAYPDEKNTATEKYLLKNIKSFYQDGNLSELKEIEKITKFEDSLPKDVTKDSREPAKDSREPAKDVAEVELSKLIEIAGKVTDASKLKPKDPIVKGIRFFRIVFSEKGIAEFSKQLSSIRTDLTLVWDLQTPFEDVLKSNNFHLVWEKDSKSHFDISKIYELSLSVAEKTTVVKDKKEYPELFILHFAKIMNFITSDERLQRVINTLEKKLKVNEVEESGSSADFSQLGNFMNPAMLNNLPPQFRGMAKSLMNNKDAIMKLGSKFTTPQMMSKISSGDFKGVAKSITQDQDLRKEMANLGPMINPYLKQGASMFRKNGVELPDEAKAENEDITIETMMDKLNEKLNDVTDEQIPNDLNQLMGMLKDGMGEAGPAPKAEQESGPAPKMLPKGGVGSEFDVDNDPVDDI